MSQRKEGKREEKNRDWEYLEKEEQTVWEITTEHFSSPVFPPFAAALSIIFALVSGKNVVALLALTGMFLFHVLCFVIEEDKSKRLYEYQMKASSFTEPLPCNQCGERPEVCYLEEIERFYVRCKKCSIQTEFHETVTDCLDEWNIGKGEEREDNT